MDSRTASRCDGDQAGILAWSAQEQLRYCFDLPDEEREAIVGALQRESGHRRPAALARLESHGRIARPLQNQINEWLLSLIGIGEDAFMLNAHMAEGQSILDFETLLAYAVHGHAFQQAARREHDDPYLPEPYTGALHATWARVLLNGRLCYVTLSMASWYLFGAMQDAADELIQLLVPHRHIPGPEDGKGEDGMVRWDLRVDASGQEALLVARSRARSCRLPVLSAASRTEGAREHHRRSSIAQAVSRGRTV